MCGIAGIWSSNKTDLAISVQQMADKLTHRGPDDGGHWQDPAAGIALAHRRLSIIDLSANGHQPMVSASGRYVLSYNGEIYNFQSLRAELDYPWRGTSDTEVLLAMIENKGIEQTLPLLNGMFALALWDTQQRTLTLARDRMGEKPLYYGWWQGMLCFASELKAFKALDHFSPTINREALHLYARYSYIAAPYCIFENIYKLKPAHYVTLQHADQSSEPIAYWSLSQHMQHATQHANHQLSQHDHINQLESVLSQAVKQRMIADVPLGCFLSGGIDSTTIALLMQQQSTKPIKTFSIGFQESRFDEAPYAKALANFLGTDHTELYVTAQQAQEVISTLPTTYDEPFADSSQIPTYLVSQMAARHVTVALSGDGGDELFAGYNRHIHAPTLWYTIRFMPLPLRKTICSLLERLPIQKSHHHEKLLRAMSSPTPETFYQSLCSIWHHPDAVLQSTQSPPSITPFSTDRLDESLTLWMMKQDLQTYLPGDILTKVDRAAMANQLETRIPFLDIEVMEYAWQLPLDMKIQNRQGKWIVRQLLNRHIPSALTNRPKAGFALPLGQWLRGPLRDWAENLLHEPTLYQQGYLNPTMITSNWKNLLRGNDFLEARLWNILMFQHWLAEF